MYILLYINIYLFFLIIITEEIEVLEDIIENAIMRGVDPVLRRFYCATVCTCVSWCIYMKSYFN